MSGPMALSGIRVADISNFLAAPMASMFLGDYGAEVVKVEHPSRGDEMRFWGENKKGVGLYYKVINRNKKSVTADLRTPIGVEIVKRLVRTADVVIENYASGTTASAWRTRPSWTPSSSRPSSGSTSTRSSGASSSTRRRWPR